MRGIYAIAMASCLLAGWQQSSLPGEQREIKVKFKDFNWKKYVGFSEWHGIYSGNNKCGYKHTTIVIAKRNDKETVRIKSMARIKVKAMGSVRDMSMTDMRDYDAGDGRLLSISLTVGSAPMGMTLRAYPEDGKLICDISIGGTSSRTSAPMPAENLLSALAGHALVDRKDVSEGDYITGHLFEAASRSEFVTRTVIRKRSTAALGGVEVQVYELEIQRFASPGTGKSLPTDATPSAVETITLDSTGRAIRGSAMGQFSFRLEGETSAKRMDKVSDIMLSTAVPLGKTIPGARGSRRAVLRISNMPPAAMLNDRRQHYSKEGSDHILTIGPSSNPEQSTITASLFFTAGLLAILTTAMGLLMLLRKATPDLEHRSKWGPLLMVLLGLPISGLSGFGLFTGWTYADGSTATELSSAERTEYVSQTTFLQSEDPRIRALAEKVVGTETDSGKAAALLNQWVYKNVRKEFTPIVSNALDTLNSLRGDCGEHTALFVALCRARDIPAREVAGLAYTDAGGGILGGHAWAEVHIGGNWIAMDPTFGQRRADALHIKIADGGMSNMSGMMRLADLMSKIKVQILSVE